MYVGKSSNSIVSVNKKDREGNRKDTERREGRKKAQHISVGDRCPVNNPKAPPVKRGAVMYVGKSSNSIVSINKKKSEKEAEIKETEKEGRKKAQRISVGDRCQVAPLVNRGTHVCREVMQLKHISAEMLYST